MNHFPIHQLISMTMSRIVEKCSFNYNHFCPICESIFEMSRCSCKLPHFILVVASKIQGFTENNEYISPTMKRRYICNKQQLLSVKSRHHSLIFYKISIPIYAFLPALRNPKDASAIEILSTSSQPASHGFLDCSVILVMVTSQVNLQGPRASDSLSGAKYGL
jgi:hypothetical protein